MPPTSEHAEPPDEHQTAAEREASLRGEEPASKPAIVANIIWVVGTIALMGLTYVYFKEQGLPHFAGKAAAGVAALSALLYKLSNDH